MYRLRFIIMVVKCLFQKTKELDQNFDVSFFAWPILDTDIARLFTQTYSTYMGICRWNYVLNSKFRNVAIRNGWAPVTTAETIEYKRSIKVFDRITVRTRLIYWNDQRFFIEQIFLVRGQIHAKAFVEGLIRGPSGIMKPPLVFAAIGLQKQSPEIPVELSSWSRIG